MTYCNPFLQFNFSPTFALGNYLGSCLSQTLFGNLWGRFNSCFNQGFYDYGTNYFSPPPMCDTSVFTSGGINYSPQFTMPCGFDTFSFNGSNSINWGGFGNNFDWSGGFSNWGNFGAFTFNAPSVSKTKTSSTSNINNGKVANLAWWKEQGYNEERGKLLAENTIRHSNKLYNEGVKGECGKGVRLGINDTFYDGATHYSQFGNAKNTGYDFLSKDSHFKKVDVSGMKLTKDDIPAGAIIIYDGGYSSGKYSNCGHIEVSDGNGHGYSDLTTTLLQNYGKRKEPKEIWIPV